MSYCSLITQYTTQNEELMHFALFVDSEPLNWEEAKKKNGERETMIEELKTISRNGTIFSYHVIGTPYQSTLPMINLRGGT